MRPANTDWDSEFAGWDTWGDTEVQNPENLVRLWAGMIDAMAVERTNAMIGNDPSGVPITKVYVTPAGHDLQQLIQKFLLGAVAFSQGADDYLDDDLDGKGLNADNTEAVEGKAYTALEHAYDEGFGYFGAARDYLAYTDDEIAGKGGRDGWSKGYYDTNGDGQVDLKTEINWGIP